MAKHADGVSFAELMEMQRWEKVGVQQFVSDEEVRRYGTLDLLGITVARLSRALRDQTRVDDRSIVVWMCIEIGPRVGTIVKVAGFQLKAGVSGGHDH